MGFLSDRPYCLILKLQLNAVHLEQSLVLLDYRILGLRKYLNECVLIKSLKRYTDRHTPYKLGDYAVFHKVFRLNLFKKLIYILFVTRLDLGIKSYGLLVKPVLYYLIKSFKSTAADKEDIGGIYLYELLVRMLPSSLRRNRCHGSFYYLKECLLNAFTRYIPCDRYVLTLPRYLVYLIDIDDAVFGTLDIIIRSLDKL